MKVSNEIIYRFEKNIDQGTFYLFDLLTNKVYKAGEIEYKIISLIKVGKTEEEIILNLQEQYQIDDVDKQIREFINYLLLKNIVTL